MQKNKLLSVIVPVYNCEKYLSECLDSLARQHFNDEEYEVLVVNDGSTDASKSIAERYCCEYNYFRLISTPNRGVSAARNEGIRQAVGKYITFVDADDYVRDNIYIPIMHSVVKDNLGAFYFSYTQNECEIRGGNRWKLEYDICYHKCAVVVWSVIYERDLLIDNNLFFEPNIMMGEDYLFNVFFTCACSELGKKVGCSKQKLYFYRTNTDSICQQAIAKNNNAKTILIRSLNSNLLSAVKIKDSEYYIRGQMKPFLEGAISENLLGCLWYGMLAAQKPGATWAKITENGLSPLKNINVKNIEGHSFRLRLKSEIQYFFRYYPVYCISCYLYRVLIKISNCFRK